MIKSYSFLFNIWMIKKETQTTRVSGCQVNYSRYTVTSKILLVYYFFWQCSIWQSNRDYYWLLFPHFWSIMILHRYSIRHISFVYAYKIYASLEVRNKWWTYVNTHYLTSSFPLPLQLTEISTRISTFNCFTLSFIPSPTHSFISTFVSSSILTKQISWHKYTNSSFTFDPPPPPIPLQVHFGSIRRWYRSDLPISLSPSLTHCNNLHHPISTTRWFFVWNIPQKMASQQSEYSTKNGNYIKSCSFQELSPVWSFQ